MIEVIIYRTKNHEYTGFDVEGHAEYGEYGKDVVCAAASILVINTINSIARFTTDKTSLIQCSERGLVNFRFEKKASHDAHLLIHSMIYGLQTIEEGYGADSGSNLKNKTDSDSDDVVIPVDNINPYIDITFKEV